MAPWEVTVYSVITAELRAGYLLTTARVAQPKLDGYIC